MFRGLLEIHCKILHDSFLRFNSGGTLSKFQGWVKNVRKLKSFIFIDLFESLTQRVIQIVVPKDKFTSGELRNITHGSSIQVLGTQTDPHGTNMKMDVHPEEIKLIGQCPQETYPIRHATEYSTDFLRKYLHLRGRTDLFRSMLTLRSEASYAVHKYFHKNMFMLAHPPVITSMDCEGAGDQFRVSPANEEVPTDGFFRGEKYLTVSGQFHLEAIASGNSRVYSFGPTFRADKSHTRRHLAEFYMVEAEMAFCDTLQRVTMVTEELCRYVIGTILDKWDSQEVEFLDGDCLCREKREQLRVLLETPFSIITYSDATEMLMDMGVGIEWGQDLHVGAEQALTSHFKSPLFVTNYPAVLKPFYMLQDDVVKRGRRETVSCFDLLWPGLGELAGGSLREHRLERLESAMTAESNTPPSDSGLSWYLDLRRYGGVHMGGFGLGFERLLQAMTGMDIRDTIPFPRFYKSCSL